MYQMRRSIAIEAFVLKLHNFQDFQHNAILWS